MKLMKGESGMQTQKWNGLEHEEFWCNEMWEMGEHLEKVENN